MARHKIKAIDAEQFRQVRTLAEGHTPVFVTSERRLYLATGDLSLELRRQIEQTGAVITVERPHHLESGRSVG
jgi:hypothetical protein